MIKRPLAVDLAILERYALLFRQSYKEMYDEILPIDSELTSTDFEKNWLSENLRSLISEKVGAQRNFHPINLYKYIFHPLREKSTYSTKNNLIQADDTVLWDITKMFPMRLFELLGFTSFDHFLESNRKPLGQKAYNRQRQLLKEHQRAKHVKSVKAVELYHCYISDKWGYKVGRMSIDDAGDVEFQIDDSRQSYYRGIMRQGKHWRTIDLWQIEGGQSLSPKKCNHAPEVSFKFLSEDDFKDHIFVFGTYAAINLNDFTTKAPARVAGPIALERTFLDQNALTDSVNIDQIKFRKKGEVDPIIAAKISCKRIEEKKYYQRRSCSNNATMKRLKELQNIDIYNTSIRNPAECIGQYICLVYSKTHRAIRKLIVIVNPDLTVSLIATKYRESEIQIQYKGMIKRFSDELFTFSTVQGQHQNYLEGSFSCKSAKSPMYGLLSGIFRDSPKAGRAILIPVNKALEKITPIDTPGFIDLDSTEYKKLDNKYHITELNAGASIPGEAFQSKLAINDSLHYFKRKLEQKKEIYQCLTGIYEEYYFDARHNTIVKDYLFIYNNGQAIAVCSNIYKGIVKSLGSHFTINFKCEHHDSRPVFYLIHQENNSQQIFSGIFTTPTENGKTIISASIYLKKIDDSIPEMIDYNYYRQQIEGIKAGTKQFQQLNKEIKNLGHLLMGEMDNNIIKGHFEEVDIQKYNCRKVAYTFFQSACFLASANSLPKQISALQELKQAFKYGFRAKILLDRETKKGGALYHIREMIDVQNFKVLDHYTEGISYKSLAME